MDTHDCRHLGHESLHAIAGIAIECVAEYRSVFVDQEMMNSLQDVVAPLFVDSTLGILRSRGFFQTIELRLREG